jgi:DNA-binding NtrC family response regulator
MSSRKVLVIDDDPMIREAVIDCFEIKGYAVAVADSLASGVEEFCSARPDVTIVDYELPDGNALDFLRRCKEIDPTSAIMVLTGHGTIDLAVRAIKEGAEQFITKPVEPSSLYRLIEKSIDNQKNERRQIAKKVERARYQRDPFLGQSPLVRRLAEAVHKFLGTDRPILIQGETGTGKGVLASWIHANGPRHDEAFVDLNCAGLSKELLESELFGHERGSFTGAVTSKMGLLEVAHKGTAFLDEIGDMDTMIQPKLLKVIEDRRFRRLGEVKDRAVDVHLIAATHRDLAVSVAEGRFRSDLFFRINTITLQIPPLRDRLEDVPLLAGSFIRQLGGDLGRGPFDISSDALAALSSYSWPGNIRELRNVLERAALLCERNLIQAKDLSFTTVATTTARETMLGSNLTLDELERMHIEAVLQQVHGKVETAAHRLGIPRSTLYAKLKQYQISGRTQ